MSFESELNKSGVNIQEQEALDNKWYERFKSGGAFHAYEYFTGDKEIRQQQKNDFLSEKSENPELDYPVLENFDFEGKEK